MTTQVTITACDWPVRICELVPAEGAEIAGKIIDHVPPHEQRIHHVWQGRMLLIAELPKSE